MITKANIIRYAISILILFIVLLYGPYVAFLAAFILLLINNTTDDILFYNGNKYIKSDKYKGGIISPVNGIVTKVEKNVDLFGKVVKNDCLTSEWIIDVELPKKDIRCNHITIFLNKFNHHLCVNPFDIISTSKHYCNGEMKEMVNNGELIADNKGEYLNNDSLIIDYGKCYVVLTLDKYISKYIYLGSKQYSGGVLICKGSQCDIYVPAEKKFVCEVGDVVHVYQTIVEGEKEDIAPENKARLKEIAMKGISLSGGYKGILFSNIRKTLSTFSNMRITITLLLGMCLTVFDVNIMYLGILCFYSFVFERMYKNLMYAIMNSIGVKSWMIKSYGYINKMSKLWKR